MPNETTSEMLIAPEVARWLRVSPATIYFWAATGKIPSVKLNGTIRFVRADIQRWLDARAKSPDDSRPSRTRASVPPIPAAVSRQTIQRAGARVIRHVMDTQSSQQNSASGSLPSTADVGARKDTL